jgi:hypothetical protein
MEQDMSGAGKKLGNQTLFSPYFSEQNNLSSLGIPQKSTLLPYLNSRENKVNKVGVYRGFRCY